MSKNIDILEEIGQDIKYFETNLKNEVVFFTLIELVRKSRAIKDLKKKNEQVLFPADD